MSRTQGIQDRIEELFATNKDKTYTAKEVEDLLHTGSSTSSAITRLVAKGRLMRCDTNPYSYCVVDPCECKQAAAPVKKCKPSPAVLSESVGGVDRFACAKRRNVELKSQAAELLEKENEDLAAFIATYGKS